MPEQTDQGSVQYKDNGEGLERGRLTEPSSLSSGRKLLFGLVIVSTIACSWVGSTQTSKSAFDHFKAPFFSMWFGTSWMITLFPLSVPLYFLTQKRSFEDLWRLAEQGNRIFMHLSMLCPTTPHTGMGGARWGLVTVMVTNPPPWE